MIIYPVCITLSVAFILLASGFLHEALGLRTNYIVTNNQTGRLLVTVAVVYLVGLCPAGDVLTGAWFGVWMLVGTATLWPVLNRALGPIAYRRITPLLIEARPPTGYHRVNLELQFV